MTHIPTNVESFALVIDSSTSPSAESEVRKFSIPCGKLIRVWVADES